MLVVSDQDIESNDQIERYCRNKLNGYFLITMPGGAIGLTNKRN